jgi:hypothetical protein
VSKLLIAVKSCLRDVENGYNETIRDTWGKDIKGADLKFFIGDGWDPYNPVSPEYGNSWSMRLEDDEILMHVRDDYDGLPYKTKWIAYWSEVRYDHVFLCDTDSYIIPSRLIYCGFQNYDLAGRFGCMPKLGSTFDYKDQRGSYPNSHPWPSGGVGYFLSKKAAEIVADAEIKVWAEDMHVGQVLGPHIQSGEIKAWDIPDFEANISWHFPRRQYDNHPYDLSYGWMQKMFKEYGA